MEQLTQEEQQKINDEAMEDYAKLCKEEAIKEQKLKSEWKQKLKGLINVSGLFRWLDEGNDYWNPIEIVEIELTDEKRSGYSTYQHVRVKNDKVRRLYMKQTESEIRGINHICVWQINEYEDSYSGNILFPLKDGTYFKIGYSC